MSNFTKQFTMTENLVLMDRKLTMYTRMLYWVLKSFYNQSTAICNPSYKQLMERAGIANRRVISKHLKILKEEGYISWQKNRLGYNEYQFICLYNTPGNDQKSAELKKRIDQELGVEVLFESDEASTESRTTPVAVGATTPVAVGATTPVSLMPHSLILLDYKTTPSDSNNLATGNVTNLSESQTSQSSRQSETSPLNAVLHAPDTHESVAESAGALPPQEAAAPPSRKSNKPKRVRRPKEPDPDKDRRKGLWDLYNNCFEKKYGMKATRTAPASVAIKTISEQLNGEAESIIIQYFKCNDKFITDARYPIQLLMSRCDKLRIELKRQKTEHKPKITNADDL